MSASLDGDVLAAVGRVVDASNAVRERELEIGSVELLDVGADALGVGQLLNLDDVDALVASAMARGHIHVELVDGSSTGDVTELLVEVVLTRPALIPHHDAKVADLGSLGVLVALLRDADYLQDLSVGLLDLAVPAEEVPEAAPSTNLVGGKDAHAEDARLRIGGRGLLPANDLEFREMLNQNKTKTNKNKTKNREKI